MTGALNQRLRPLGHATHITTNLNVGMQLKPMIFCIPRKPKYQDEDLFVEWERKLFLFAFGVRMSTCVTMTQQKHFVNNFHKFALSLHASQERLPEKHRHASGEIMAF